MANGRIVDYLKSLGVSSGVHYIPNHLHEVFRKYHRPLPKTELIYSQIVTLPFHSNLTDADVGRVIDAVLAFKPSRIAELNP